MVVREHRWGNTRVADRYWYRWWGLKLGVKVTEPRFAREVV